MAITKNVKNKNKKASDTGTASSQASETAPPDKASATTTSSRYMSREASPMSGGLDNHQQQQCETGSRHEYGVYGLVDGGRAAPIVWSKSLLSLWAERVTGLDGPTWF
ncbi:hypothetical protein ACEQ8H_001197 [Pleosporales sp. CAS-2024a]